MKDNNDALTQLAQALETADSRLDKILKGTKLYLDPEVKEDKQWIDLIHSFYPEDFDDSLDRNLDSKPEMYYITPDDVNNGYEDILLEGNTSVHPLHDNLYESNEIILRSCSKLNNIHNVAVAGADPHFRNAGHYDALYGRSENLFLPAKGDMVSLSQTVKLMRQVVEGQDVSDRSVIIDNTSDRFAPFLDMMGLNKHSDVNRVNDALKKKGQGAVFAVVDEPGTAIGRLNEIGVDLRRKLPTLPTLFDKVFFETSSDEKIEDTAKTLQASRSHLEILHADHLGGVSEHDPEFQWSYGGNAIAKAVTTLKDKLANPELDKYIAKQGLERDNVVLLFADGGESYAEEALRDMPSMQRARSVTHPFAEYPGAETKPVSQLFGAKEDNYAIVEQAHKELKAEINHKTDTRFVDNCVMIAMPLKQEDPDNPVYYAFKGKTIMDTVFNPQPNYHPHKTQRHFQKPEGGHKTLAEMEEDRDSWMTEDLAIAKAMRLVTDAGRVPKRKPDMRAEFDAVKDLKVMSPWPLENAKEFQGAFVKQGMRLESPEKTVNSMDDVRKMLRHSKAFFFADGPKKEGENYWASRFLLPTSVLVAKQLRDPHVNGNPMVILADKHERSDVERVLDHLKRSAMIAQDMHYLYNRASKPDSALKYIREKAMQHVPYEAPRPEPYKALPDTKSDFLSVGVLLSASAASKIDNDNAYALGANLAVNNLDQITGMGSACPMGWTVFAGLQAIREGFDVNVQGVQDPQAKKTEGWPIEEMNHLMGAGHAVVAPDIFVRIMQILELEKLQQNPDKEKVVVSQANGIGGLQEIVSVLALKEAGVPGMDRVHLIIENTGRDTSMGEMKPHDALLEIIDSRGELTDANKIYETKSVEETVLKIGDVLNIDMLYMPIERPHETIYPFAREKNPYADWLIDEESGLALPKEKTIIHAYQNAMLSREQKNEHALA